jgi:hypothetical protein
MREHFVPIAAGHRFGALGEGIRRGRHDKEGEGEDGEDIAEHGRRSFQLYLTRTGIGNQSIIGNTG